MKRQRRQSFAATKPVVATGVTSPAGRRASSAPTLTPAFSRDAILIFAVAIGVRLLHIWQIRRAPFFDTLMGDARGYDAWGQRVAAGEWVGTEVFYQAPLYPYFLGTIYAIAGHSLLVVRIVQAIIGSAACALLGLSAFRLFSRPAGLVAGLALALYAPAIFFDGLIQKSVLDVFFVCVALYVMSVILSEETRYLGSGFGRIEAPVTSHRIRRWLFLGLAIGALALTRENAMVFVAVITLWIALGVADDDARPEGRAYERLRALAAFVVGLLIVLAPVAIRNYAVGGGFYVTTSQFGPNLYIGNNARADGSYMSLRFGRGAPEYERQDATELAEHALGRSLTPAEVSTFWTDRALAFITSQPGRWLKLLGRKFMLLWNAGEMLDTESQETYAEWSLPLRALSWIGHFGVLAPLALFGAIVVWPDRRRLWVLYVMTAAYAASVIVFYVFARYRFPLVPFLILFASAGVEVLLNVIARPEGRAYESSLEARSAVNSEDRRAPAAMPRRELFSNGAGATPPARSDDDASSRVGFAPSRTHGRRRSVVRSGARANNLAIAAAAAIGTAVFANWPIVSETMNQAITENNLATAFQEDGRLDEAIAHYRRAIALESGYAPPYNNLGAALRASGHVDEAVASYQQALATEPDYPDAHYNLANALLEKNQPEAAAEHFRIALEKIPSSAGTHNNLGIALAAQGKLAEAVAEFRAALAAEPDSAKTHRNLGNALSSIGQSAEAIEHLRRAAILDPKEPATHYDLASDLLQANQLTEAAAEFREALRLDPKSAEAHNNLGIALASMGQVDEAITEFQQAVTLQPDFADARRNLAIAQAQKKRPDAKSGR